MDILHCKSLQAGNGVLGPVPPHTDLGAADTVRGLTLDPPTGWMDLRCEAAAQRPSDKTVNVTASRCDGVAVELFKSGAVLQKLFYKYYHNEHYHRMIQSHSRSSTVSKKRR